MQQTNTRQKQVLISEFRPMMRGFDCQFIVLELSIPNTVRDGQTVQKFKVADITGSIVCTLWGDYDQHIKCGDILRIEGAEAKLFKGTLTVTVGRYGKLFKVGEQTMLYNEVPYYSEFQWIPEGSDQQQHQYQHQQNQPQLQIRHLNQQLQQQQFQQIQMQQQQTLQKQKQMEQLGTTQAGPNTK